MLGFFKPLGISISQASFKSYSLQIFLTNLLFFFYCSSWASLCVLTAQYFLNIYVIWSDFFTLHFLGSPKQNPKHLPFLPCVMGFLGGSVVKNASQCSRCKRHVFGPWVRKIPWRRKCNLLQYSFLEKSMNRGGLQTTGSQKVRHN